LEMATYQKKFSLPFKGWANFEIRPYK
jgi:hypothetical protein